MNDFIWVIMCLALIVVSGIFLGLWTYRDAQNRGLNAKLWTLIVILGPSGIGILLYFLVARKQSLIECSNCSSNISRDSKYCNKCGNSVTEIKEIEKKPTKYLIIGFVVSFIISMLCFIGFIVTSENLEFNSGSSLFLIEVNTKKKWNISYYKSTSEFSRTIKKEDNNPSNMYIDASCDEGSLAIKIKQGDKEEVIDISNTNGVIKVDLNEFENGEIKLFLIDEKCKGVSLEAYWE
ncbi:MAG: hypothetical protein ACRC3Y_05340 [Romboutsia sp.]|uniref:hypothetical protein n=1 Tax=Romboutsia sp. TaxID=1965302 RepID=UPI003F383F26